MTQQVNDIIKNISQIVKFDSSQQPALPGKPFGEGPAAALKYFLDLAEFFGFETKNYDNYVGEVIFGKGEDFAVLCHLDVVPAGSGWEHEPFGGEIDEENKRIWGRGTMDDKGPAIIALHAMKALKDKGFKPKKTIKLIVGCNEESGWACIDHYNEVATMPEMGFTPDADFPVIYAEKGIMHIKFAIPKRGNYYVTGGGAANMVCDYCELACDEVSAMKVTSLGLTYEDGKIVSRGKSAHGSTPEKGVNAMAPILQYLGLTDIYQMLFVDKCGLADWEDVTGKLTFSPDVISSDENNLYITCDMRFPATYTEEQVKAQLATLPFAYEVLHVQKPLYNDKECFLIKTLCEVYNEVTGKNLKPIAIGGGTYARAIKCGAGFGPEEPDEESTIHQPNEYITFAKIEQCYQMYTLALERLTAKK